MQKTERLRDIAYHPVNEWPELSDKDFFVVLWQCALDQNLPFESDIVDYMMKSRNSVYQLGTSVSLGNNYSPYLPVKERWILPVREGIIKLHKGQPENNPDAYPEWDEKFAKKEKLFY